MKARVCPGLGPALTAESYVHLGASQPSQTARRSRPGEGAPHGMGPVCLLGLVLCALPLLAGGCRKKTAAQPINPAVAVRQYTGITLPKECRNVLCYQKGFFVQWVFGRFDMPAEMVKTFLAQEERLPDLAELKQDNELLEHMHICGRKLPWWDISRVTRAVCGRRTGRRNGRTSEWEWAFTVCVASLGDETTRVYMMYTEEPVGPPGSR